MDMPGRRSQNFTIFRNNAEMINKINQEIPNERKARPIRTLVSSWMNFEKPKKKEIPLKNTITPPIKGRNLYFFNPKIILMTQRQQKIM